MHHTESHSSRNETPSSAAPKTATPTSTHREYSPLDTSPPAMCPASTPQPARRRVPWFRAVAKACRLWAAIGLHAFAICFPSRVSRGTPRPTNPRVGAEHAPDNERRIARGDHVEYGGEAGIRTRGTLAGTLGFQPSPFGRSGTSPRGRRPMGRSISSARPPVKHGGPGAPPLPGWVAAKSGRLAAGLVFACQGPLEMSGFGGAGRSLFSTDDRDLDGAAGGR